MRVKRAWKSISTAKGLSESLIEECRAGLSGSGKVD